MEFAADELAKKLESEMEAKTQQSDYAREYFEVISAISIVCKQS